MTLYTEATTVDEFLKHRDQISGPAIATLFASRDNKIGFRATGRFPIRNKPTDGTYILDGTKS